MEGKSSYFVLLVIVAFLSIALAFLAIGYFFWNGNSAAATETVIVQVAETVPSMGDLTNKVIFESKNFNLKKTSDSQIAIISFSASMKYLKKVDELTEEEVTAKIDFYNAEINEAIGTYFKNLTLAQVADDTTMTKAKEDLLKQINEMLTENDKKASPPVYSLTFYNVLYQ